MMSQNVSPLVCLLCSDPKVYEVTRTFTGTRLAWLDAVNAMENGYVSHNELPHHLRFLLNRNFRSTGSLTHVQC